ncbi:MAG: hypothetical protein AABX73_01995 [Nanoarchaeota archaeon]
MPEQGFTYGGLTILSHPIFVETILPFLLVFTIVFAVLQKSRILGEGKKQVDAIVALVIGLLVISFSRAVGIITQLIPFLAVTLVIILVLLILVGSFSKEGDFEKAFPKPLRIILMVAVIIALVIAVLLITGAWDFIYNLFFVSGSDFSGILLNVGFIIIIAIAIAAVIWGGRNSKSPSSSSNKS